jgi:hypothetical protein
MSICAPGNRMSPSGGIHHIGGSCLRADSELSPRYGDFVSVGICRGFPSLFKQTGNCAYPTEHIEKTGSLEKTDNKARLENFRLIESTTCLQRKRAGLSPFCSRSKSFIFNTCILLAYSPIRFLNRPQWTARVRQLPTAFVTAVKVSNDRMKESQFSSCNPSFPSRLLIRQQKTVTLRM